MDDMPAGYYRHRPPPVTTTIFRPPPATRTTLCLRFRFLRRFTEPLHARTAARRYLRCASPITPHRTHFTELPHMEPPEYESAQLRSSGWSSQAYAFSVFTDQQSALAAMHSLNGLVFDLERESSLHIDLAKSNSRSKWSRTDETYILLIEELEGLLHIQETFEIPQQKLAYDSEHNNLYSCRLNILKDSSIFPLVHL